MPFEKGHATNLGRKLSKEVRQKMSEAHKGSKPYLWGAGFAKGNEPWNKRASIERNVYYAALLDGEGSVFFVSTGQKPGRPRAYKKLTVAFAMREDKAQPLPEGHAIWGGSIHRRQPRKNMNNFVLDWRMHSNIAERFLNCIKPYLKIKFRQVEIALKYRDLQRKIKKNPYGIHITEGQLKYRTELEEEMTRLNH